MDLLRILRLLSRDDDDDVARDTRTSNNRRFLALTSIIINKNKQVSPHHFPVDYSMQVKTMFASALVAVTSSTAAAFAPKTQYVFQHATRRAFSRSTVSMMANPKGA
jgi:hypothetical protein